MVFTRSMRKFTTNVGYVICSMSVAPPPRAKISGIRASVFGDVVCVDHCEIELKKKYVVLLVLDGATNLLWATAQNSFDKKETMMHLPKWNEQNNCTPKAIVGDEAFFSEEFLEHYKFHGIKALPCGPRTPWPNRAETAVRLFKKQWTLMATSLEGDDRFNGVTIRQAVWYTPESVGKLNRLGLIWCSSQALLTLCTPANLELVSRWAGTSQWPGQAGKEAKIKEVQDGKDVRGHRPPHRDRRWPRRWLSEITNKVSSTSRSPPDSDG